MAKSPSESYLEKLKERARTSRVYSRHQSLGLHIAQVLGDMSHKTLYMKLVKEYDGQLLLAVAMDVAKRSGLKNKGAYFMRIFAKFRKGLPARSLPKKSKPPFRQMKLRLRPQKNK